MTGPCEPTRWTLFADSHISDGQSRSVTTLSSCQSACVTDSRCTAIDWNGSSSEKCWHHGPWSAGNQMNSYTGVDHYQLTRNNCDGNSDTFKLVYFHLYFYKFLCQSIYRQLSYSNYLVFDCLHLHQYEQNKWQNVH